MTLHPSFSNSSSQEHSLFFSQNFSYSMPLLRTTPLVQLLLHIDTSFPISPILYCSSQILALHKLYTPHSFCGPHLFQIFHQLPLATPGTLKSTTFNGPPFTIRCSRAPFPYLKHLITLLLSSITLNFLLSHTLPNLLTSQHNSSSSPHLPTTAGLSQTCHHSHSATPVLSQER